MEKKQKKIVIIFSILIGIFSIGIVGKTFQNDTFFNISIGKYILENGIDMKEHFSWIQGLTYTYSHWAFDIIMYLIYNNFGFTGIYISIILFSILINIVLFNLLTKRGKQPVIAFIITLISAYIIRSCYTARSQIVSFLCFIVEIYCIEKFIETNKKRYAVLLIVLSIIVANFHAATWPMYLVLFLPYFASAFFNFISPKNRYVLLKKRYQNKLKNVPKDSKKSRKYEIKVNYYADILEKIEPPKYEKMVRRENYNIKNLVILFVIICFTGLITPIYDTPYTYVIKSMFGESNFENNASVDFIMEMQPITPAYSTDLVVFLIILLAFLIFMPTKLKLEQGFLILGLLLMTIISARYVYLLVFLGSYVLMDLITQCIAKFIPEDMQKLENILVSKKGIIILSILIILFVLPEFLEIIVEDYVDEELYPVGAVEYIKENLDYKNMRIYNSYNNGSYLMLNEIPVFIDSRLDVYCSEFNDTDVFYDFTQVSLGKVNYEDVFKKYDFTHILIYNTDIIYNYIKLDHNYKVLYEDENFTLYERNV
ncbi:MAG TPA: hypothetical protein IAD08_05965 [Candidatus Scatovivens faecipullorum]|nr:hypothetical protein [Candidatus Scatovivens faecipullorum]